jgi:hypothetical protein
MSFPEVSLWTAAWLGLGWLLVFLLIEIPAVLNQREGDTLSEHIWRFVGWGQQRSRWVWFRCILFVSFGAWLIVHLASGGWI